MLNMKSPVINQIIAQNGGVMPNQQQPPNMNIGYNGYNGQYDGYSMNPNQNYAWVNGQPVGNPSPYAFPPPQNPYDNGYQQPNYGYAYNPAFANAAKWIYGLRLSESTNTLWISAYGNV